jgi:hypothetical protein
LMKSQLLQCLISPRYQRSGNRTSSRNK